MEATAAADVDAPNGPDEDCDGCWPRANIELPPDVTVCPITSILASIRLRTVIISTRVLSFLQACSVGVIPGEHLIVLKRRLGVKRVFRAM